MSIMGLINRLFGPPPQDKFAQLLLRRLKEAMPNCEFIYDREAYQLRPAGEDGLLISLGNLYAEYRAASGPDRHELVNRCLAAFVGAHKLKHMPDDFDEVMPGIMPSIRGRSYFDLMRLAAECELSGVPPKLPIYQPINEHLVCGFVYDSGPSMRFLHHEDLETWGKTIYEIMEVAKMNFEQKPPKGISKIGDSFYSVLGDGDYGATRLIQDELLAKMEVEGDMIAVLPNRGTLMVTGTDSDEGLKVMAALLEKEADQPRPITRVLFRQMDDEWEPWLPPTTHPTHAAFKLAAIKSVGGEYHEQKPLLEKLCEAHNDDVFVASFSATKTEKTGEVSSCSVWSKGVPSLLPRTDTIGLVGDNQDVIGMVAWDEVAKVAGDLMVPQGMYPERYRVESFLSDDQLAALAGSFI
jgi:uncharacterized protein YtpQ (UPF0354 family)